MQDTCNQCAHSHTSAGCTKLDNTVFKNFLNLCNDIKKHKKKIGLLGGFIILYGSNAKPIQTINVR